MNNSNKNVLKKFRLTEKFSETSLNKAETVSIMKENPNETVNINFKISFLVLKQKFKKELKICSN